MFIVILIFRVKHKLESDSKSTAIHAKMLAPDFVKICEFPMIPDYDESKVVLIYPQEVRKGFSHFFLFKKKFFGSNLIGVASYLPYNSLDIMHYAYGLFC